MATVMSIFLSKTSQSTRLSSKRTLDYSHDVTPVTSVASSPIDEFCNFSHTHIPSRSVTIIRMNALIWTDGQKSSRLWRRERKTESKERDRTRT